MHLCKAKSLSLSLIIVLLLFACSGNVSAIPAFGFEALGIDYGNRFTQFKTRVTDANGVDKETYKDVRQRITSVHEFKVA